MFLSNNALQLLLSTHTRISSNNKSARQFIINVIVVEVVAEADEVKSYMGLMNRSLRLTLVLPLILFLVFKIKEQKFLYILRIKLADKV